MYRMNCTRGHAVATALSAAWALTVVNCLILCPDPARTTAPCSSPRHDEILLTAMLGDSIYTGHPDADDDPCRYAKRCPWIFACTEAFCRPSGIHPSSCQRGLHGCWWSSTCSLLAWTACQSRSGLSHMTCSMTPASHMI